MSDNGLYIYKLTTIDEVRYVYTQSYDQKNPDAPLVALSDLSNKEFLEFQKRRTKDTYLCRRLDDVIGFITMSEYLDGINLGIHLDPKFRGKGYSTKLISLFISKFLPKEKPIYAATSEDNLAAISSIKKMGGEFLEKKEFPSRGNNNSVFYLMFRIRKSK